MTYLAGVKWLLGISLALALAAGGCDNGDDGDSAPRTTVPPATSTTTMTPADPYAVPATIDEAYVQRVVQKLYDIESEAVRVMVQHNELMPEAVEILRAAFLIDELNAQLRGWSELANEGQLSLFRENPGNVIVSDVEVIKAGVDCIEVRTTEDVGPVAKDPGPPLVSFLVLRPKVPAGARQDLNPTPWMIARESTTHEEALCGG